jgi:hypothetical protein
MTEIISKFGYNITVSSNKELYTKICPNDDIELSSDGYILILYKGHTHLYFDSAINLSENYSIMNRDYRTIILCGKEFERHMEFNIKEFKIIQEYVKSPDEIIGYTNLGIASKGGEVKIVESNGNIKIGKSNKDTIHFIGVADTTAKSISGKIYPMPNIDLELQL